MITTANLFYWIIFIGIAGLSWLVSARLQSKFKKYSRIPLPGGLTGPAWSRRSRTTGSGSPPNWPPTSVPTR